MQVILVLNRGVVAQDIHKTGRAEHKLRHFHAFLTVGSEQLLANMAQCTRLSV